MSVEAFNGIGRVNKLSQFHRVGEERCQFVLLASRAFAGQDGASPETRWLISEAANFLLRQAWDVLGANCAEHLSKGSRVRIVGQLRQSTWTDAEGRNRSRLFVRAEHVEFIPRRKTAPDIDDENVPF